MADEPTYHHQRWSKHFEEIDKEIARHALTCKVPLLDPGVIQRVLQNDTSVCGSPNQRAFDKMRSLLMMHYSVREKAVVAIGQEETMQILDELMERLRHRVGDKLGNMKKG